MTIKAALQEILGTLSAKETKSNKDKKRSKISPETMTKEVINDNKYISINNYLECKQ